MWAKKQNQRWLWHAIDCVSGKVLAYAFGRRCDQVFLELKKLLEPFASLAFTPMDGEPTKTPRTRKAVGKQHTQKIESKHINLRTN